MKRKIKYLIIPTGIVIIFALGYYIKESMISEHDKAIREAEKIVSSLTLEEKIGQMIMPAARCWSDTPEDEESYENMIVLRDEVKKAISDYNLSGICLFSQNVDNTEQLVQLTYDLQEAASQSSAGIPLFISADQEGGNVYRLTSGTSMIGNMALAATGDASNARQEAEVISSELKAAGINIDFAPDADINDNPENPIIGVRSFSDDADTVVEYASVYIEGLHENGIISCIKHFPGHGNTATDSHTGLPEVDKSLEELEDEELKPFAALCNETDMIMTAHIQFPEIEKETYESISTEEDVYLPATMSKTFISDILRDEIGFDGVVVTDSFQMAAIQDHFELNDAVLMAINADVDLILMPFDLKDADQITSLGQLISDIADMVNNGKIEESEIDDSVIRILALKIEKGIMNNTEELTLEDRTSKALEVIGSKENHDIEWDLAKKAITLYQDSKGTYANGIKDGEKVLYLYATSTQELSLDLACQRLKEEGISTENIEFNNIYYDGLTLEDVEDSIEEADRIILVTWTSSLSSLDLSNPENSDAIFCASVINAAKEKGKEVDLISSVLPYDAKFYKDADVILLAYNGVGVRKLPEAYDGHVRCYGANLPAAIASLITGEALTGQCPIKMDDLDFD